MKKINNDNSEVLKREIKWLRISLAILLCFIIAIPVWCKIDGVEVIEHRYEADQRDIPDFRTILYMKLFYNLGCIYSGIFLKNNFCHTSP